MLIEEFHYALKSDMASRKGELNHSGSGSGPTCKRTLADSVRLTWIYGTYDYLFKNVLGNIVGSRRERTTAETM